MARFFEYALWPTFHDFDNFPLFNAMFPEQFFNNVLQPNYSRNFQQWHSPSCTLDPRRFARPQIYVLAAVIIASHQVFDIQFHVAHKNLWQGLSVPPH